MLTWALVLAVVAIIAAMLASSGFAGAAAWVSKLLFGVYVLCFIVALLLGLGSGHKRENKFPRF